MINTKELSHGNFPFERFGVYVYALTHLAILIGMSFYYIFTARFMSKTLLAITICFHIISQTVLLIFPFIEPGIMRKIYSHPENTSQSQIPVNQLIRSGDISKRDLRWLITIDKHLLPIKTCRTCFVYRPPRTVHCFICDACMDRFDHHCDFLGSCVAKRNYPYFFAFITSVLVLLLLIIAQTIIVMANRSWVTLGTGFLVLNVILLIYATLFTAFVSFLTISHIYLMSQNMTTYEWLKKRWNTKAGNPYKRQCVKNYINWLCSKRIPSQISTDLKQQVDKHKVNFQNLQNLIQSKTPQIRVSERYPVIPSQTLMIPKEDIKKRNDSISRQTTD